MITDYKITEIFCAVDEFCKEFDKQIDKKSLLSSDGKSRRYRKASLSDSEIMTILIVFQFGSFRNFKHYYQFFIRQHLKSDFPNAVSYNRFVELQSRVFFQMMFFLNLSAFGRCTGISFVDSTMVPVCHNLRRYANKVFKGLATDGKGTMGWCHGFKLHLVCNDRGEIITFCFTGANVDDRDPRVWAVLAKTLYGKLFADRGYISPKLFDMLFEDGVHLVTGIRTNMKNKLMPMWDKVMLRKRCIIETINDMLKNTAQLVHSRHRSLNNFIMSMIAALAAYCFFDNKPQALQGYCIENTKQLMLFKIFLSRTGVDLDSLVSPSCLLFTRFLRSLGLKGRFVCKESSEIAFLLQSFFVTLQTVKHKAMYTRKLTLVLAALLLTAVSATAVKYKRYAGGDISMLTKYEQAGKTYRTDGGSTIPDVLTYLHDTQGLNTMRVRLFVDPTQAPTAHRGQGVCQNLGYVVQLARRIKNAGMCLLLDLHYSDTWTDPGQHSIPARWNADAAQLADSCYSYTREVLEAMNKAGATPDFIQVGNEVNNGMLWETAHCYANSTDETMDCFINCLKAGSRACREVCPRAQIVFHTAMDYNADIDQANWAAKTWPQTLASKGVDYDIIGLSYYPNEHGPLTYLEALLTYLETNYPSKTIQIVETSYHYNYYPSSPNYDYTTTYPATEAGQKAYAEALVSLLNGHSRVNGLYWWFMDSNEYGTNSNVTTQWYYASLWNHSTGKPTQALPVLHTYLPADNEERLYTTVTADFMESYDFSSYLSGWTNNGSAHCTAESWLFNRTVCSFWKSDTDPIPDQQLYQTVTLPAGTYELSVDLSTIGGATGFYLFAGDNTSAAVTAAGSALTPLTLSFTLDSETTLDLGFRISATTATWANIGPFKLRREGGFINVTDAGYATFYSDYAFLMPDGLQGFIVTGAADDRLNMPLTYTVGQLVPRYTGIIVKGDAGAYTFDYIDIDTAGPATKTGGTTTDATFSAWGNDYYYYKLAYDQDDESNPLLGFFWGAENGGVFENKAHRAYVGIQQSQAAARYFIMNELTGINHIQTDLRETGTWYTLDGRRLDSPPTANGVYIHNGEKTVK